MISLRVPLLLLVATAVLLATAQDSDQKEWWETTVFYQIYPRSFFDSNDDGTGDIKGITAKLQHLKDTGFEATWLSPIFQSPQEDFGYDVSDFVSVDPLFGSNSDLEELFAEAEKLGIKIILDFVPNHSSNEHEWFVKSENRVDPYTDYYMWHNGKPNPQGGRPLPPNNWQSVFYGSAWEWSEKRQQYYLHQFAVGQPDLNYRNEAVIKEFDEILRYWMKKGASGFRIDAINHMFEVEDLRDEPINDPSDPNSYGYTHHIYTKDLPDTYEVIARWRKVIDDYVKESDSDTIIMMTEAYANLTMTMKFYESDDGTQPRAHFPFNFAMIEDLNDGSKASNFKYIIDRWLDNMPRGKITNWVLGNHDKPRMASRYGRDRIDGMALILMTLPGVAVVYNGEEIGMEDYRDMSYEDSKDPQGCNLGPDNYKWASRDPQRTPFQWDDSFNAGFSKAAKTWLPMHPLYRQTNLLKQTEADYSTYHFYVDCMKLRKERILTHGEFRSRAFNDDVFAFVRFLRENEDRELDPYYVTLVNFHGETYTVDVTELYRFAGKTATVRLVGTDSRHKVGQTVNTTELTLGPYEAIVIGASSAVSVHLSMALLVTAIIKYLFL
ncbi:AAEL010540-PA [Aedes aegypti]|uniref:alpha-glucosidase n=2 Tax=Aedes aegypti TaxID=7159 RepID=Q16SN5_AEDAE|nr:maltase 1 [Aedes aegypti]EAT37484.1 AAEL010540-PA [Aedes aegypti]